MRVYPDRLSQHLAGQLAPIYLVSGDEPLQSGECCDAIRSAARAAGYSSRTVVEAGAHFDWQQLTAEAAAFSLFGERKLIDLRIPNGKPGTQGSKALVGYCEDPPPDTLLMLTLPKLERQQQNGKWFKVIDALGVVIQVWPIDPERLPVWIGQRLRSAGIQATDEALKMLADRVEGNLLAACQEIDKLLLLHGTGPLDTDQLQTAVADSARYDVFELVDSALRGEAARCLHILQGLRGEGTAPAILLWALHREARGMAKLSSAIAAGRSPDQALKDARVLHKRSALVRRALAKAASAQWLGLLDLCHQADRAIKGSLPLEPWLLLEDIVLAMAGSTPPVAASTGPREVELR